MNHDVSFEFAALKAMRHLCEKTPETFTREPQHQIPWHWTFLGQHSVSKIVIFNMYWVVISSFQLIYIARNPRDTVISYFYFMQLLTQSSFQGPLSSFIDMFLSDKGVYVERPTKRKVHALEDKHIPFPLQQFIVALIMCCVSPSPVMYSPYFGHVLGYWHSRQNPNILFVTYEELHQDPPKVIRRMAEFLGVSTAGTGMSLLVW